MTPPLCIYLVHLFIYLIYLINLLIPSCPTKKVGSWYAPKHPPRLPRQIHYFCWTCLPRRQRILLCLDFHYYRVYYSSLRDFWRLGNNNNKNRSILLYLGFLKDDNILACVET
jgi:hypothetical protein